MLHIRRDLLGRAGREKPADLLRDFELAAAAAAEREMVLDLLLVLRRDRPVEVVPHLPDRLGARDRGRRPTHRHLPSRAASIPPHTPTWFARTPSVRGGGGRGSFRSVHQGAER